MALNAWFSFLSIHNIVVLQVGQVLLKYINIIQPGSSIYESFFTYSINELTFICGLY